MRVLIVEDDPRVRSSLDRALRAHGYVTENASTGAEGLAMASGAPDAIVLDVNLPDISGFEVCRALRRRGERTPVLMLTARDAVEDRVEGLDAGADDYLVKPFSYEELVARLRALGRRPRSASRGGTGALTVGPIVLDEIRHDVTVDDRAITLTAQEFVVLETLMRQAGRAMSRDELMDRAWPLGAELTQNAVEAYIHRLREKLGAAGERIETVRGVGYRLSDR